MIRVDCENNAIPVPPIIADSAKLPGYPIRKGVRPWKLIKVAHKKNTMKRGSHAEGQLPDSLYPPHENSKTEEKIKERHQNISGEVRNLERTVDGTNKMRDMSIRPTSAKEIRYLPGGVNSPTIYRLD